MTGERRRLPEDVSLSPAGLHEVVAKKVADKISKKVAHHEQAAARSMERAARHELASERLQAFDLWMRKAPSQRRPRFTRDDIAGTAIHIADTEGFDALSMRRIAAELGAGTMTLYHYVRTKDELLSLVVDAVMGEVVIPDTEPVPDNWREALALIAHRTRDTLERHPWILDISDDPPIGPNSVRHFDQTLQAVSSLDATLPEKFDIFSAVDEYVFGYCLHHRNNVQGGDEPPFDEGMLAYVTDLIATGEYPALAALADEQGLENAWFMIEQHVRDGGRFDRNLERLLDGIEAGLRTNR
jgi:AcrR family transcriptional regulator